MKGKVAVLLEPGRFEVRQEEVLMQDDEVLVKVASCGLCNWEKGFFTGVLEGAPCTLGHEWAGIVVECGTCVTKLKPGDHVAVFPDRLSGFAQYAAVREDRCFLLEPSVNIYEGFAEPVKCVTTVLRSAAPEAGDYGVVLGCGPMGLWCIQALSGRLLAGLIAIDIDDKKLQAAAGYGATHVLNSAKENIQSRVQEITGGHMADFVIEGTGIPSMVSFGGTLLRTCRGRMVLMSYYEENVNEFDFRPLADKGAIVLNPQPSFSEDGLEDTRRAVSLINNGTFRQKEMITHRFHLDEIQQAFETLVHKPADYIKGIVICNENME